MLRTQKKTPQNHRHQHIHVTQHNKATAKIKHLKHKNFIFKKVKNNDTWARDFGAISVKIKNETKLLDFKFNGWGLKYPSNYDNLISRKIFNIYKSYNFVLEGGSIDTNGEVLLTTSKCLLEENRNYPMTKEEIEEFLKKRAFRKKNYLARSWIFRRRRYRFAY